jgi:ribonuclease HI
MFGQRNTAEVVPLARDSGTLANAERPLLLTATVDASHQAATGVTGIGIVLQATNRCRRRGPILAEIYEAYEGVPASVTELLAVFRALEIARERGYPRVEVRSDYNYMRRRLKDAHTIGYFGDHRSLHGQTLALAETFEHVAFAYHPRRKNAIAHGLARKATRELEPARRPELFQSEPRKTGRRAKRSAHRAPDEPDFGSPHQPNLLMPHEQDFLMSHELDSLAPHSPQGTAPARPPWAEEPPVSGEWRQEFQNRYGECWIASATRNRFLLTGDDIAWRTIRVDDPAYEQLAAELQRKTGPAPAFEGVTLNREEQMWLIAVLLAAPQRSPRSTTT